MKRFLLSLGLVAAMAPGLMAEIYDHPTSPVPAGGIWTPTTAAPGVYSQLSGRYQLDLRDIWYQLEYKDQFPQYPSQQKICGWVINQNNEIVYEGTTKLGMGGMQNGLVMYLDIPEGDAITTEGTYYIIFPTGKTIDEPNGVFVTNGKTPQEETYNMKAGPYVVGVPGDPVDPQLTVTPSGAFDQPEGISYITLTVDNSDPLLFNVGDVETSITVKGPNGNITMERGLLEGNSIKWEFPVDEEGKDSARLPNGNYTITINYSTFSAYTTELNPITFPETGTYTFSVEGGLSRVVPTFTVSPANNILDTWTQSLIGITLQGCQFKKTVAELKANPPVLVVVDPDGNTYYPAPFSTRISQKACGYTASSIDFTKPGVYNCYWKISGFEAIMTDSKQEVLLEDVSFYFVLGTPEVPTEETTAGTTIVPAPGSVKKITNLVFKFGSDFIEDFAAWTENFNAKAIVTNLNDNTTVEYEPILSEDGTTITYDVKIDSEESTKFKVDLKLWGQQYYVFTGARALATAFVPEDKAYITVTYDVDKSVSVEEIGGETEVYYLDLNGNRLNAAPEKGIYIRVSNNKTTKEIK